MRKVLDIIRQGKEVQFAFLRGAWSYSVLFGVAVERGLARTVKHRDYTRSYALTPLGRAALKEES
jgi:hypothetical protein